jgi:uncharacterized protein YjiS (DUF1127 family)
MNRITEYWTLAVGRASAARNHRRLVKATLNLSHRDLADIGLNRDWRGSLTPLAGDYTP